MKSSITRILGALLVSVAAGSFARANSIDGTLVFTGGATINSGSADTATAVNAWQLMPTTLVSEDGTFSSLGVPLPDATILAPWTFGTPISPTVFSNFISIGSFSFDLASSWIASQGAGSVTVDGTGWIHDASFDTTAATVSFTFTDPIIVGVVGQIHQQTDVLSRMDHFTGTVTALPDGGTTAVLLGGALLSFALISRRRTLVKA
jgi:hypothetical protein